MAFDTLRAFLPQLPLLTELIEAELAASPPASNNSADIRTAHHEASQRAFAFLHQSGLPYTLITYPDVVSTCPECGFEIKGAYWELNNPGGKGTTVPLKAYHYFVVHDRLEYMEPITNLADTVIGHHPLRFEVANLKAVLSGISLPPELEAELNAVALPQ